MGYLLCLEDRLLLLVYLLCPTLKMSPAIGVFIHPAASVPYFLFFFCLQKTGDECYKVCVCVWWGIHLAKC